MMHPTYEIDDSDFLGRGWLGGRPKTIHGLLHHNTYDVCFFVFLLRVQGWTKFDPWLDPSTRCMCMWLLCFSCGWLCVVYVSAGASCARVDVCVLCLEMGCMWTM